MGFEALNVHFGTEFGKERSNLCDRRFQPHGISMFGAVLSWTS